MHLLHILFDGKGIKDVFVIFCLMVLTKLITHNHSTLCRLGLAPTQIIVAERGPLEIHDPGIKLGVFQDLVKLFRRRSTSHDDHIGVHGSMVRMEAFLKEVINCIRLAVSKQEDVLHIRSTLLVLDSGVLRSETVDLGELGDLPLELHDEDEHDCEDHDLADLSFWRNISIAHRRHCHKHEV
jgi:hypothetical protein